MASVLLGYIQPGTVTHVFHQSVIELLAQPSRTHSISVLGLGSGPLISRARNEVIDQFLARDEEFLFFVDTDISFQPEVLDKLIELDKPIVSAHYKGISPQGEFPVALLIGKDGLYDKASYKRLGGRKGCKPVDAVGMGCTLIKREVIQALDVGILWPFAEITGSGGQALGEDTTFCQRAKELGFQSWISLDIKVGHLKSRLLV